jgi:hypothetical protein
VPYLPIKIRELLTIASTGNDQTMIGQASLLRGSLTGLLFPLHPRLFQFSLLAHLLELELELPFPLIV